MGKIDEPFLFPVSPDGCFSSRAKSVEQCLFSLFLLFLGPSLSWLYVFEVLRRRRWRESHH